MINILYLAPHDIKQRTLLGRHLQGIWDSTLWRYIYYDIYKLSQLLVG